MRFETKNNFDLIRLVAATQVVLIHASEHLLKLSYHNSLVLSVLHFLPGVPIFFFVSGFLIASSFDRTSSLQDFAFKRIVRIFPALWVCFFVSILAVLTVGYLPIQSLLSVAFVKWAIAQLSFFQFYNAEFMRGFGVGVLNGSLWTICVELQFYFLMPLLAWLIRFKTIYILMALVSFASNIFLNSDFGFTGMLGKLMSISFLPWIGMFMLGNLAFDQWHNIKKYFSGKFLVWFALYLVSAAVAYFVQHSSGIFMSGNQLLLPLQILLGAVVLSAAFTQNGLSQALLRRHDISYGIYIYHMPIINILLFSGLMLSSFAMPITILATMLLATLSWLLVEQPALRQKSTGGKKL